MSVLITGSGLLGPHVAENLIDEWNERPTIFGTIREPAQIAHLRDRATVIVGDVTSLPEILAAVSKGNVQTIIHTAAMMTDPCDERPYAGVQTNVIGSINVIEAARAGGVKRIIFASTVSAHTHEPYQTSSEHTEIHETDPIGLPTTLDPPTKRLYLATKIAAEQVGRAYAALYGIEFTIVRLTAMYGPMVRRHRGTAGVIQQAIEQAVAGKPVLIHRRWAGRHGITYVKDAARALVLAAKAERLNWESYNIGPAEAWSFDDVAAVLQAECGLPVAVEGEPDLAYVGRLPDLARARSIGYEPRYDLRTGLRDYLRWARSRIGGGGQ